MSLADVGGKISADKKQVGIVLDKALVAVLTERGDALRQPMSTFARWVIEDWRARGCPPVNEPDRLMQVAKAATGKTKKPAA